jgi:TM2 domain-containing membrane protein YozV
VKCPNCGRETQDQTKFCGWCGADMKSSFQKKEAPIEPEVLRAKDLKGNQQQQEKSVNQEPKSKLVAGLLGIFIGGLGIHNFYLGYTNKGLTQLLLSTVGAFVIIGPFVAGIWGFIEGIQILTGDINMDANGVRLKD